MIERISPLGLIQTLSLHFPCLVLLLVTSPDSYAHPFIERDTSLKPFSCFFTGLLGTYDIYVITPIHFSHLSPSPSICPCASYHFLSLTYYFSCIPTSVLGRSRNRKVIV